MGTMLRTMLFATIQMSPDAPMNIEHSAKFLRGLLGDDSVSKFPPRTLIVLTYDEAYPYQDNYVIYTLLIGDMLKAGRWCMNARHLHGGLQSRDGSKTMASTRSSRVNPKSVQTGYRRSTGSRTGQSTSEAYALAVTSPSGLPRRPSGPGRRRRTAIAEGSAATRTRPSSPL
jgi:hypothetical protein